jgi:two-component system response regulator FixJ
MNSRTVHVIDDDDSVRDALRFLFEITGYEVRVYDSGNRFLDGLTGEERGCIVTDVRMPGLTGLELAVKLRTLGCKLPIIVITGHADLPLAVEAMRAGAQDFIEKPFDDVAILGAVNRALAGAEAVENESEEMDEILRRLATLSTRERQVLEGLVVGKANKVTARDLDISPRTVAIYRANVMTKMQADSLSHLVRMAFIAGRTN